MEERDFNPATVGVASTMAMSGRVTAKAINPSLETGKEGSLRRIAGLNVIGSLMTAGLLVALAPVGARAEDKDIRAEIQALQEQVASLQATVSALQTQLVAVQSNPALALGPFVSVDPNPEVGVVGPQITFKGANIHIVSGSGLTNDNGNSTGLGNLIIGYDEDPALHGVPLGPGDRGGSHNLVLGRYNRFTRAAFGGLVAGELNEISNEATTVSGGLDNTASGVQASVSGGAGNVATGLQATVSGGVNNDASGLFSSVIGGAFNTAGGQGTVVIGSELITDNNNFAIAPVVAP